MPDKTNAFTQTAETPLSGWACVKDSLVAQETMAYVRVETSSGFSRDMRKMFAEFRKPCDAV
ncbi:hypothetical protein, partial [Bradyrhizobium sp. 150]|uniref:hypothetical protein n=1 Tax=Bradyrhizobium sp. 150 TaxID=2782625 RepID=UPI001FF749DF